MDFFNSIEGFSIISVVSWVFKVGFYVEGVGFNLGSLDGDCYLGNLVLM